MLITAMLTEQCKGYFIYREQCGVILNAHLLSICTFSTADLSADQNYFCHFSLRIKLYPKISANQYHTSGPANIAI